MQNINDLKKRLITYTENILNESVLIEIKKANDEDCILEIIGMDILKYNSEFLKENFSIKCLEKARIYIEGQHDLYESSINGKPFFLFGSTKATIIGFGTVYICEEVNLSSFQKIKTIATGNSVLACHDFSECYCTQNVTVSLMDNSQGEIKDQVTLFMFNKSRAKAMGFSTVNAYDNTFLLTEKTVNVEAEESVEKHLISEGLFNYNIQDLNAITE